MRSLQTIRFFPSHGLFAGLCLLALFLILLSPPMQAHAAGPLEALKQMQRGVDNCDSDTFHSGIDVDSVVNKASDALMVVLREQAAAGNLGDSNLGMALAFANMAEGSGQGAFLKQMLVSEVKNFLVSGVNGCYFAGKPSGTIKASGLSLASTLEKLPKGRREIIPGKVLSDEDGKAEVSAVFVDPEAGRFPLRLAVEQRGKHWKVVEILNADEVFQKVSRHSR